MKVQSCSQPAKGSDQRPASTRRWRGKPEALTIPVDALLTHPEPDFDTNFQMGFKVQTTVIEERLEFSHSVWQVRTWVGIANGRRR